MKAFFFLSSKLSNCVTVSAAAYPAYRSRETGTHNRIEVSIRNVNEKQRLESCVVERDEKLAVNHLTLVQSCEGIFQDCTRQESPCEA